MGDIAPGQTIYISNLYEKLKKEETKKLLYALFGQFGKILDVVCLKTPRLRGQAWVVFADITSATNALRAMQGFPFFDKPVRLQYAKTKSDAVSKLDGSYKREKKQRQKQLVAAGAKQPRTEAEPAKAQAAKPAAAATEAVDVGAPNRVLFLEGLPEATTEAMLTMLFQQFPGYKESRLVEGRPGIAFVEFENDVQAGVALSGLQGFKITPQNVMKITYGK
ncbi:hypothetical protein N2152v2_000690 [Parachlorella kessleri]